ncbi:MAG: glycosyltransferase family 25 protein [Planctomycetaceae bacterium]|nr:MAG: glycosyltransferase family 25 protein [Planctomycetaceae bacterium]
MFPPPIENQDFQVNIPCYFINLDQAVSRCRHMEHQAVQLGISLTRIPAVIGATLTPDQARAWNPNPDTGKYLVANEIAVFLSHRRTWETIADGECDYAAVFEDDVFISPNSAEILTSDDWIPAGTDIVKTETFNSKVLLRPPFVPAPGGRQLAKLAYQHYGTAGYIISRDAAARLLIATTTFSVPVDVAMFTPKSREIAKLDILQLSPAICIQEMRAKPQVASKRIEASSVEASRSDRLNGGKAGWRRSLKAVGAPIENVIREARQHVRSLLQKSRWAMVDYC